MEFKDKALTQMVIECAFKVYSTLGKGFLENELMNVEVRFILSILKHPVNPVRLFSEKATTRYCPH